MPGGLTEFPENCQMSNYRDALSVAARMRRIAKQRDLSIPDRAFLDTAASAYYWHEPKWAARMRKMAKREKLSTPERKFLGTEAALEMFRIAQGYKAKILRFNSFVPWAYK